MYGKTACHQGHPTKLRAEGVGPAQAELGQPEVADLGVALNSAAVQDLELIYHYTDMQ